ncbi:MAG: hypothetical protein ACRBBR_08530 [Cellvibrionaceae bacterium]
MNPPVTKPSTTTKPSTKDASTNAFSKCCDFIGQAPGKLLHFIDTHTAIAVSAISVVIACIMLWLIMGQHHHQRLLLIDAYGDSLSKLASSQLKVPMSANNLIGLQSVLNDLIKQDRVINAVVYNIDNKISVQAGEIRDIDINTTNAYTSPINLDDALLGSLTINIDNKINNNYWLIIILLLLIAASPLIFLRKQPSYREPRTAQKEQSEKTDTADIANTTKQDYQILTLIEFSNLERLYKQLNAEARNNEIEKLRLASQKILTLYSGKVVSASTQTLTISFESKDKKDCLSNAVCFSYLLAKTKEAQQWLLDFSIFIHENEISIDYLTQLNPSPGKYTDGKILIKKELSISSALKELIAETKSENGYADIISLSTKYEKLIESQLAHTL